MAQGGGESPSDLERRQQLAERYIVVTNREALMASTYEQQLRGMWSFCKEDACKADLDRAISESVRTVMQQHRSDLAQIYARHLTEAQLIAALNFAESPEGRAITAASDDMTAEAAQFGNVLAMSSFAEVGRRFCPTHKDVCTTTPPVATRPQHSR